MKILFFCKNMDFRINWEHVLFLLCVPGSDALLSNTTNVALLYDGRMLLYHRLLTVVWSSAAAHVLVHVCMYAVDYIMVHLRCMILHLQPVASTLHCSLALHQPRFHTTLQPCTTAGLELVFKL